MLTLYRALTWLAVAAVPPWALFTALRHPARRAEVRERCGGPPAELARRARGGVWLQAASVGELQLARALVAGLARRHPNLSRLVSVTTPAAREMLARDTADSAGYFTFPLDLPPLARQVVETLSPALFVAVETEIWPNLYGALAKRRSPIAIVNARISDRTLPRYQRWHGVFRAALAAVDVVCARSEDDAGRFAALGVPHDRLHVTGNLKFDRDAEPAAVLSPALGAVLAGRRVLVAGSVHPGEDATALAAARRAVADGLPVVMILAPRHAARLDEMAHALDASGVAWTRRSALDGSGPPPPPDAPLIAVLLDTHGELSSLYAHADVALLGGTLVNVGGHNPLEAAAAGVPTVTGPNIHNQRDSVAVLQKAGGLIVAPDTASVEEALARLLVDEEESRRRGGAARGALADHRGALDRTLDILAPLLHGAPG